MLRELIDQAGKGSPIFFIGIGGVGVSGIARLFHRDGYAVAGTDLDRSPITDGLLGLGIRVTLGHHARNLPADAALVICSAAIKPGHPELEEARRLGIPVFKYAQALGSLMDRRRGIAVAGTHGKTTTTAMIAHALVEGGLDPTMVVGGEIPLLGGTSRAGGGDLMVAEACEYDRSFLNLHPLYAVITNIEEDHLDYYRDLAEIRAAFRAFAAKVPASGRIFVCAEDAGAIAAVTGLEAPLETYGIDAAGADWRAEEIDLTGGTPRYTLVRRGADMGRVALAIPGRHNVLNSLVAIAVAHAAGVPIPAARKALAGFPGVNRRFQVLGEVGGAPAGSGAGAALVDDYAHHPTEIRSVIRAARERYPGGRVIAIFQPHQYSRTRHLLSGFADALAEADHVVLPDIYFARDSEADCRAVSARDLAREIGARGVEARYIPSFEAIAAHVREIARTGDVVLTIGAGDVYRIAYALRAPGRTGAGVAA